jgi:glucosamine-6-phosphate deaminase
MNILRFDSAESWVDGTAAFWCGRLQSSPRLRHCLTSGNTPLPVYDAMVRAVAGGAASFRQAEIFALDEYGGLPLDDEGRCANMLHQRLVDHIDLPKDRLHHFNPEAPDLDQMCRDYDAAIEPGFDLTILGLGLNGHLGLNEPGSAPESPVRRVSMHEQSVAASAKYVTRGTLPRWGVTVGLQRLLNSKEVWLLVNGQTKAEILRQTLLGEISSEVPASLLRRHPRCYLFADAAATPWLDIPRR